MLILNMLILKQSLFTLMKSEKNVAQKKTDLIGKAWRSKIKQRRKEFGVGDDLK